MDIISLALIDIFRMRLVYSTNICPPSRYGRSELQTSLDYQHWPRPNRLRQSGSVIRLSFAGEEGFGSVLTTRGWAGFVGVHLEYCNQYDTVTVDMSAICGTCLLDFMYMYMYTQVVLWKKQDLPPSHLMVHFVFLCTKASIISIHVAGLVGGHTK